MPILYVTKEDHRMVRSESVKRDTGLHETITAILNEWRESLRNGSKLPAAKPAKRGRAK